MNLLMHVFNMKSMSLSVFHTHNDNHSAEMDDAQINELHQMCLLKYLAVEPL